MLGVCSLNVLWSCMSNCWSPFLHMVGRRRGLGLGLYRWTTSGLLGIREMDNVPNIRIRQFCVVTKAVDEKIDEGVLRWFGNVERMENDRIAKRVYVGVCAGSRSVGVYGGGL